MGFWSGFEGLTGHRPGAFKGFSFKDILDDDLWKRHERLGGRQSRQFEETGVVPTTAWYRGRGRPEMMGPRVGAAGVPPVDPAAMATQESPRVDKTFPSYEDQFEIATRRGVDRPDVVSAARPWANIQAQMLRDPLQGVGSMRIPPAELMGTQVPQAQPNRGQFQMSDMTIPPAELMGEKTTVKKIFADPTKSDTVTETIKEKVPMGNMRIPTSELMGGPTVRREHSGYFPPPPNWLERTGFNPGYFGRPASIMNMRIPTSELAGGRDEDRIREMFRVLQGIRARRGY